METEYPNYHLVLEGFTRLKKPLVEYEVSVFKKQYGDRWWDKAVLDTLRGDYRSRLLVWDTEADRIEHIDTARALILMFANWDTVFQHWAVRTAPGLTPNCRHISNKLFDLRNDTSHLPTKDVSVFAAMNGLKQMSTLCKCFDEKEANRIEELIKEIVDPAKPVHSVGTASSEKETCSEVPEKPPVQHVDPPTHKPVPENGKKSDGSPSGSAAKTNDENFLKDDRTTPMDISETVRACIQSTEDQLRFDRFDIKGVKTHESVVNVNSFVFAGLDIICTIQGGLVENQIYMLRVDNETMDPEKIEYTYYDRDNHIVGIHVEQEIADNILSRDNPRLTLVSDLSFLVRNVHDFFVDYGDMIGYLPESQPFPDGSYSFPSDPSPQQSQRDAVRTVLNSRMSYVWGAPGTGKTQMVLATSILACIKAGQKVAIIAPTNLSVEQVLRGLMNVIKKDESWKDVIEPSRDILRLGMASDEFLKEYPQICENKSLSTLLSRKQQKLERIREVPFERELQHIENKLLQLRNDIDKRTKCSDESEIAELDRKIRSEASFVRGIFERYGKLEEIGVVSDLTTRREVQTALDYTMNHTTINRDIAEYFDWTDDALRETENRLLDEIIPLELQSYKTSNMDAKILACTPHTYLARFEPKNTVVSHNRKTFDVDRIFIDEAGYCSAVLALTLLANHVPVTLLGDHKQLPPVCPANQELIDLAREQYPQEFTDPEFMRYWYMWDLPSIYLDTLFIRKPDEIGRIHGDKLPPVVRSMECCSLKESYRFGKNLAEILDSAVYHNGITGNPVNMLSIEYIDVPAPKSPETKVENGVERPRRLNKNEVEAISDYLTRNPMDPDEYCILTPYKDQLSALSEKMPKYAHRNILTVHRSQGREWGTVILSVQDGDHMSALPEPLRFTSSAGEGLNLINTAVSRAKDKLVIVCDREFWMKREGELIAQLLSAAKPCKNKTALADVDSEN